MTMLNVGLRGCPISVLILLGACGVTQSSKPTPPPSYVEILYTDLVFEELGQSALAVPGIPGCSPDDLRPFGWKTVDSGFVDIRTPEDYAIQTESLYQEGYLDYLQTRVQYPATYPCIPELSYDEFLATCKVFPEVDFEHHSVLGAHATGTGCTVAFEKHVYRDDPNKKVLYKVMIAEEGECESTYHDRNLVIVPRIPPEYSVEFYLQQSSNK